MVDKLEEYQWSSYADYIRMKKIDIGKLFEVSSTAVTKSARRVSVKMKEQKEVRKNVERIICSVFKV